ncbi:peptidase U32 family protein [Fusobacterium sp. PH5-44]|uniref:peptidase U32 family protein n=1 Tax=unclassified Fusobacterium TaxID=2648384 RepID=UPI003D26394D
MKIVAPAGNIDRFYAAVKGGANEIYMGLKGYGARRNADNFTLDEFIEALEYAHLRNVRILLTLNTIVKDNEMDFLYENLKQLYLKGLDAVIVQDFGYIKYIKRNFPDLEIHGSTQMTITNYEEINYLKTIGLKRIVLARELSFEEIKEIKKNTNMELEVFVSGALCVSYSGNCYMSSFIGGRSGNRGLCAQPCRKQYFTCDGNNKYFLSPKDQLLSKKEIEQLAKIGIDSIKVEGRMKDPNYVYETVNYYKQILDGKDPEEKTSKFFNRGYTIPYFYGVNSDIINKNYSFNIGENLGRLGADNSLKLSANVTLGDGIIFLDKNYNKISGSYLNKICIKEKNKIIKHKKALKDQIILLNNLPSNAKYIFRNYSKESIEDTENAIKSIERKSPVDIELYAKIGENPEIKFKYIKNNNEIIFGEVINDTIIERAKSNNTTKENILEKLNELGNTPFYINKINMRIDENIFFPISLLKNLKRDAIKMLEEKIIESYVRNAKELPTQTKVSEFDNKNDKEKISNKHKKKVIISAIVSNDKQKKLLEKYNINKIYEKTNPVINSNKVKHKNYILASKINDIILNRSSNVTVNWNMNIANRLTINQLEEFENIETVIISPELSLDDIKKIGKTRVKKAILAYSRLLVMYTKVPIFSEEERVIENEQGDKFIVIKNKYDNSEIYFEKPLNIINDIEKLDIDIDEYILEFTTETEEEIIDIIEQLKYKNGAYYAYNYRRGVY